jgi:DNA polymerase V
MSPQYAIVDGNNFYVSCERVFNPKLEGRPVIVLSNNDGCAVARSDEAKSLGIKMGQPWFEVRTIIEKNNGIGLSSNYELYADMSRRMMSVIGQFAPEQEVYSIDESFLYYQGFQHWNLTEQGRQIRHRVKQWTGIPVGVGIGPTKTLAKLANRLAKRHPDFKAIGVCNLQDITPCNLIHYMSEIAIEDIWGIGRKWGSKLRQNGIQSAQDLKMAHPETLRRQFNVTLERTVRELNGIACIPLEDMPAAKQQIIASRSFGQPITEGQHLAEALATHTARAAEKLRREGQRTQAIQVFISTNAFNPDEAQYHPATLIKLTQPTDDSALLIRAARMGLRRIFRKGYKYKKCGVMLLEMTPAGVSQGNLFATGPEIDTQRRDQLLATLDSINHNMGCGTLRFAAEGINQPWQMRRDRVTPAYTTDWKGLPFAS